MVLILIPRKPEEIYLLYDKNDNKCKSLPIEKTIQKGSFYICDGTKFIHFIKNTNKKSRSLNLNEIENFVTISRKELLKRFGNDVINQEKSDFDLLNREKQFEFKLLVKDSTLNSFKIIPVTRLIVICTFNVDKL